MVKILSDIKAGACQVANRVKTSIQTQLSNAAKKISSLSNTILKTLSSIKESVSDRLSLVGRKINILTNKAPIAKLEVAIPDVKAEEPSVEEPVVVKVKHELVVELKPATRLERMKETLNSGAASLAATAKAHPHITAALIAAGMFGLSKVGPAMLGKLSEKIIGSDFLKGIGENVEHGDMAAQGNNASKIELRDISEFDFSHGDSVGEPTFYPMEDDFMLDPAVLRKSGLEASSHQMTFDIKQLAARMNKTAEAPSVNPSVVGPKPELKVADATFAKTIKSFAHDFISGKKAAQSQIPAELLPEAGALDDFVRESRLEDLEQVSRGSHWERFQGLFKADAQAKRLEILDQISQDADRAAFWETPNGEIVADIQGAAAKAVAERSPSLAYSFASKFPKDGVVSGVADPLNTLNGSQA